MDKYYHGTSKSFALKISEDGVDPSLGGGELGQGFYVSDKRYVTENWAEKRFGFEQKKVMKFELDEDDLVELNPLILNYKEAVSVRKLIRDSGSTRDYLFERNIVWSEIVGVESIRQDQFKFETRAASNKLREVL